MHYQGKAISLRALESGVVELCFDRDADAVNKFDQLTLGELREALGLIAADSGGWRSIRIRSTATTARVAPGRSCDAWPAGLQHCAHAA